jgi:hypothetical protein
MTLIVTMNSSSPYIYISDTLRPFTDLGWIQVKFVMDDGHWRGLFLRVSSGSFC